MKIQKKVISFLLGPVLAGGTAAFGFFIPVFPFWLTLICIFVSLFFSICYSKIVIHDLKE
jgi:hypothetical protein